MFPIQIPVFVPNIGAPMFHPGVMLPVVECQQPAGRFVPAVRITDIYQAARNLAIEEHEIDKLFNPEFYNYEI